MTFDRYVNLARTEFLDADLGLVVSVSASHAVGRGFASRSGNAKGHNKNDTNCLLAWHACFRRGV